MKKINDFIFTFVFLIFLLSMFSINSKASTAITATDVKSRMLTNENVPIIIILKEKAQFQSLSKENAVSALKSHASSSQNELGTLLHKEEKRGKADKIKQFWIVNAIAVNATPELIERLSARDDVASIELDTQIHEVEDYSVQVSQGQIDGATSEIKRINATKVWELGIDGSGINVSIIDTGINDLHPDISGRVIKWIDYIGNIGLPYDDFGHGTHVAGTVGGNGNDGTTTGVAPNVSLFGVKVLDRNGNGLESNVINGIEWSIENKAKIISLSIGSYQTWTTTNCDIDNPAMSMAINNAINAGIIVVAAAGNNPAGVSSPGCLANVIAVGAVGSNDAIADFSGIGAAMADHGVVAPGVSITSLNYLTSGYIQYSGTSMATPHVSGAVALLLQAAKKQGNTLTPALIKSILKNTSIDLGAIGKDNIYGAGRINVSAAVFSLDIVGPSVIANPTYYPIGLTAAKNGTIITINFSISDALAGVKNVTVNALQINSSLGDIVLTNNRGFWNSSMIVNTSDGIYYLNLTSYDNAGNMNNTAQVIVIVDNTRPNVTINPVSYQGARAAKTGSIIEFNISAYDPIVNSTSSGLKNASVNVSRINNTGIISLTNNSGSWKGNVTIDKSSILDGNYSLDVSFSDNAGNINSSEHINVSKDNTPPSVADVSVSPAFINLTDSINITANITDFSSLLNLSDINIRITYPNGTSINYPMFYDSSNLFYYNFSDTAQYGLYNVTILANDTTGNTNSTQHTQFTTARISNLEVNITGANTETFTAAYSNTTLRLDTNNSSNGTIQIIQSKVNLTSNAPDFSNPAIYVLVNASQSIRNNLTYVILTVNYTDAEVSSFVESSLRLYRWNNTSSEWEKLSGPGSPPFVNDAGVDTVNNYVWANITKLSEFAIGGDLYIAPAKQPTLSGGGGGGGGGGGASGENYNNIEVVEKYDLSIYKDKVTSCRFTNDKNPVMFVNVTGNISFGDITASIEVLKSNSTMVNIQPQDIVYMNVNIWVGSSSFNRPKNIKEGIIRFRILNSWLENNNITNTRMVMWDGSDWKDLETNKITKDSTYTYYDASTRSFANFAITGTKGQTGVQVSAPQSFIKVEPEPTQSDKQVADPTKKAPGFEISTLLLVLCYVFSLFRQPRK